MNEAVFRRALAAYAAAFGILDPIRFQVWSERGITLPQARVLFLLAETGDQPVGDLAGLLEVAPPTMTGITDRLVRQGLIERHEDRYDRRVVRLSLTEDGRRLTTEIGDASKAYLRDAFERLDEDRLQAVIESLEALAEANAQAHRPAVIA